MKYASSAILLLTLFGGMAIGADGLRETTLRQAIRDAGLVPVDQTWRLPEPAVAAAGKLLFESKELSLSRETSCQTCHLDRFASADGLPLGIGTDATGEGKERLAGGGDVLPRNTMALWGRGGVGYEIFFWDGRVEPGPDGIISQFGAAVTSDDPLAVAAHLPMVEIREMVPNDGSADVLKTETIDSGQHVYDEIAARVRSDVVLSEALTQAFGISKSEITIEHVTDSLAGFIRDRFRLQTSPLHNFAFGTGSLSAEQVAGGLLFYGRGRCVSCHSGPYFTDFSFHAIPAPQLGSGRNGFGVDYGRFNVTHVSSDIYKFRTPPLYNVTKTAPYSHSGALPSLPEMIRAHVDPLYLVDSRSMTTTERGQFYQRIAQWSVEPIFSLELSDDDIKSLVAFLSSLDFPHDVAP
ncbi:MAG TPA: His-Xaa-Ser system-associated MauG-like protein [Devosia sp.]|jgi:cytochrome c peroxidase|uniref:His-Xaa-Ser system-associated MauG-like protein n=1 Tax=Devosia sp. TaxID=1871048 RepID=UPI002DDD72C5|nr:His-Xaa-Ser system-associated MauG-like protein [Devosia sp.]HEV2515163.1 His-Xaa-Ser system-associated MauG-like protein [Devosia sp.]